MTDEEYALWLDDPSAIRCVLIEPTITIAGVTTTLYLSTKPYTKEGTSSPTPYRALVVGGFKYTEQVSLGNEAGLSAVDIDLDNVDGVLDAWLGATYVWVNQPVLAYHGDPKWDRADFRLVYSGIMAGLMVKGGRDQLAIKLRDKMQRLNTPVTETKLGGSTANKDKLIPLTFGEVHNVTGLLSDPTLLKYQVHGGAIEDIIEVRDNGKPVGFTETLAAGTLVLTATPADGIASGAITISVQGDKPSTYSNNISTLVQRLVTDYGKASDQFDSGDLDTANLAAFAAAHTQPVGLYLTERENVLVACQKLASSIGAQLVMSRTGLLRLIQIALPAVGTPTAITADNMYDRTLVIKERTDVVAAVKIGFCKNYTVQNGLLTTIPEDHKVMYTEEWLTETAQDTLVKAAYKLDAEPVQRDTCLQTRTDAAAEALRQLNLYKAPRTIYEFVGHGAMFLLELGQAVTLTNSRFGLSASLGMVVSLTPEWGSNRITVGVLM